SAAIRLPTVLTHLTARQNTVHIKHTIAGWGEPAAGIAHEFKNALATISGYAQMIQAEANLADVADSAAKILEQTRNITHVVTEFLKYARPLEISNEAVQLEPTMARVVSEIGEGNPRVRVRSEGQFGCIAGDEGLLRQALL